MDDLISRQAAIDALTTYIYNLYKVVVGETLPVEDCRDAAESVIDDLPTVQPENGKENDMDRETYCKDCDRSIYGKYHDCDINIENDGRYVKGDAKCYCKIVNGKRTEKYPWEGEQHDSVD